MKSCRRPPLAKEALVGKAAATLTWWQDLPADKSISPPSQRGRSQPRSPYPHLLLIFASLRGFLMYAENLAKMSLPTSKDSLYLGLRCGYL